jgi:hypothetical protein
MNVWLRDAMSCGSLLLKMLIGISQQVDKTFNASGDANTSPSDASSAARDT